MSLLSMSRPMTRGESDRGASEIADTELADSAAMVAAKTSRAFIVGRSTDSGRERIL